MNQAHSRKALLCMIPQTLERAAYYGTRALLVLFMINNIGFSRTDALYIYGTITSLAYIMKFLGGLVGDLAIGNKLAFIIGQTLTIAGILTLLNQSISGIYISAGLLALGSGMANVNMFSEISKEYSGKDNDIESGMTLLYVFTNLGAFLGICLSSVYESYQTTIILMAIIALFSLISYLLIPQESQGFHLAEEKVLDQKEGPNRMTGVGVAALFVMGIASLIYWSCFEYLGGTMTIHIYEMGKRITNPEINATSLFLDTNSVTIVISGIILALVLVKKRFTPFTKERGVLRKLGVYAF